MSNESSSTRIRAEIDDLRHKVANVEAAMRKKSLKPQRLMSLGKEHRYLVLQKKAKERELAMERNAENAEIDRQNRLAVEMEMGNVAENRPHLAGSTIPCFLSEVVSSPNRSWKLSTLSW